jgi:ParB family chromosome partitioning protein
MDGTQKPRKLGRGLASLLSAPVAVPQGTERGEPAAAARAGEDVERGGGAQVVATVGDAAAGGGEREEAVGRVVRARIDDLAPGPFQPRRTFQEERLKELAESIRTAGVMQPILVRRASVTPNAVLLGHAGGVGEGGSKGRRDGGTQGRSGAGAVAAEGAGRVGAFGTHPLPLPLGGGSPARANSAVSGSSAASATSAVSASGSASAMGAAASGGAMSGASGAVSGRVSGGVARYEIVAGERRWRAARMAGLTHVPVVVAELTDVQAAEWGLIENVQREDLGTMEKADAFAQLHERFGLSHGEVADRVGVDRVTVTNLLRLRALEPEIRAFVEEKALTAGHAKVLAGLPAGEMRVRLAHAAVAKQWPVRKLEMVATGGTGDIWPGYSQTGGPLPKEGLSEEERISAEEDRVRRANILALEDLISERVGIRARLKTDPLGTKGTLVIRFRTVEEFDLIMEAMGIEPKEGK